LIHSIRILTNCPYRKKITKKHRTVFGEIKNMEVFDICLDWMTYFFFAPDIFCSWKETIRTWVWVWAVSSRGLFSSAKGIARSHLRHSTFTDEMELTSTKINLPQNWDEIWGIGLTLQEMLKSYLKLENSWWKTDGTRRWVKFDTQKNVLRYSRKKSSYTSLNYLMLFPTTWVSFFLRMEK